MITKKHISGIVAAAAMSLAATSAIAEDDFPGEFSANVALTTDYVFRGISQSDDEPAIQGGFDWSHESGFYLGTWASSLDFQATDSDGIELDWYGGFASEFNGISYDIGALYYQYPGAGDDGEVFDFVEVYGSVGYDFEIFSIGADIAYSPDFFFDSDDAFYFGGTLAIPLPEGFGIDGGFHRQVIDDNAAFGTPDYNTWDIGLTYTLLGFDLDLRYVDTDLSANDCFGGSELCDPQATFTVSRSF